MRECKRFRQRSSAVASRLALSFAHYETLYCPITVVKSGCLSFCGSPSSQLKRFSTDHFRHLGVSTQTLTGTIHHKHSRSLRSHFPIVMQDINRNISISTPLYRRHNWLNLFLIKWPVCMIFGNPIATLSIIVQEELYQVTT